MKTIMNDPDGFFEDGGWSFLDPDSEGEEGEEDDEDEEDDAYVPTEEEGTEDDSSYTEDSEYTEESDSGNNLSDVIS